jgi:uncharacterized protein DUF1579
MKTIALLLVLAAPAAAATPPAPCSSAEHRQLDFWIGDWDVAIRARSAPDKEEWGQAKGTQHVEAVLGGCAISETFAADGPKAPWNGRSYSSWQPAQKAWRQTWVDDSGGYLTFTGGVEGGTMALYGEPRTDKAGKPFQMRMIWLDVKPDSLRWEWQRSTDKKTWTPMMIIEYRRRK